MVLYLNKTVKITVMKSIILYIIAFGFVLSSCKTSENLIIESPPVEEVVNDKPQRNYSLEATIGKFPESDPIDIDSLWLDGNTLFLNVSYTGGCALHKFEFVGDMGVMKSLPPQRNVKLIHYNGADSCESIVKQTLEIDITALAFNENSGSEIVLLLNNNKINYIYE